MVALFISRTTDLFFVRKAFARIDSTLVSLEAARAQP
jgi:hypothetical protein